MTESRSLRTTIEVAVISIIIYVLLGTPGLSTVIKQAATAPSVPKARAKVENLVYPSKDLKCPEHKYSTHILSTSPLVVYIDGFLSDAEADHLIELSESKWKVSTVVNEGKEAVDDRVRKSEKAAIPRDETVQCIEARALAFQGWPEETFIEKLWTQRYNISGHYGMHYDWAASTRSSRRVSSFMVYLKDDCVGGGTNFPRLKMPRKKEWCKFLECGSSDEEKKKKKKKAEGVTFKARKASAAFWVNFDDEGRGYKDTIHAGMPVREGQKIGLNIWSWYQAGHRAEEEELQ